MFARYACIISETKKTARTMTKETTKFKQVPSINRIGGRNPLIPDPVIVSSGRKKKRSKLTPEEIRLLNRAMPSGNKYIEAFRKHQGSFIVYDPNFML